jgi:hypothetical protein
MEGCRVIVCMRVDESGNEDESCGLDHAVGRCSLGAPDRADPAVVHAHVRPYRCATGPVDDGRSGDDDVPGALC